MSENAKQITDGGRPRGRTTAEWVLFAATLAVVLLVAGTILGLWITGVSRAPTFTVSATSSVAVAGVVHRPVEVTNTGTRTAASVQVVARDSDGHQLLSQNIDYVSGGETVIVTFVLPQSRDDITFSVASFQLP